jgi:hypothetical protein
LGLRPTLHRGLETGRHTITKSMILSASEESLINVVRALPPEEARKVLGWAQQLAELGRERVIEWSDSWSEEDLADATAASLRRFDEHERENR